MAEPIKISTSKYKKEGKVDIDGHIWTVKLPGAGTELRMSQAFRRSKLYSSRIELIDKKIDKGKATEEDLDNYEEYSKKYEDSEKTVMEYFTVIFQDSTKNNSEVKKWVEETPTHIIELAFNDITNAQTNSEDKKEETDGQPKPSESS